MSVKLFLSLLPGSYEKHREKITGSHGNMDDPEFARRIFEKFLSLYRKYSNQNGPKTLLELGPGGSLASGLLAHLVGFENSILIDVGDFALRDVNYYARLLASLPKSEYYISKNSESFKSFHQITEQFSITYKTNGLNDLKLLPSESTDLVFSNSVLEHVRAWQFLTICQELYRIQKVGTTGCHHVDFKDHLGGGLNHLRFSSASWEKEWMVRAGFYTNRIDFAKMYRTFEEVGFHVTVHHQSKWNSLPIPKEKMALEFRQIPLDSLQTKGAMFVLRK